MPEHPLVHIHYSRPPDREEVFVQELLLDTEAVKVTFARDVDFPDPIVIEGEVALEGGSDAVWFTFPGAWHDIGRFYRADGTFTGIYANVLTPCDFGDDGRIWRTEDLFLDVWIPDGGEAVVLDEDQLDEAVAWGWVDLETATRARREAAELVRRAREGSWPPGAVAEWTRARALERASDARATRPRP